MKYRFEIFDKLLDDSLHDDSIIVLHVLGDHHRRLPVRPEGLHQSALEDGPDVVGGVEGPGLDGHEEGDPLVVGGVGGVILALHALQLHDTLEMRLILRRYVRRAVNPTKVLRQVRVDSLELTTETEF